MTVSEVIRRSKGLEILLALAEGPKFFSDLQRAVGGSSTTVEDRVTELLREGVIKEDKMESAPFRRTLTLTERGKEVAGGLRQINGLLDNQLPERRHSVLMAMLSCLGEVRSRTKLEKLVFLLQREIGFASEQPYSFGPHRIGPYSRELIADAEELKRLGIIEEETTIHPSFRKDGREVVQYTYRITPSAHVLAQQAYDSLSPDQQRRIEGLRKYNEMPLAALLKYVHDKWPELQIKDSSR